MLALDVTPMSWPVGMGGLFEGIYDLVANRLMQPSGDSRGFEGKAATFSRARRSEARRDLVRTGAARLRDEAELAMGGYARSTRRPIATAT
jgi:peptide chain release factor 3